jgi:hypothetical protein
MRILSLAVFAAALSSLSAVHADTPVPGKSRIMGQTTVTDGQKLDWPNCAEGETPGVQYGRPSSNRYLVGSVEVQSNFGSWIFHIQAFSPERHNPLSGADLQQVQIPVTLYCKPNAG